MLQKEVSRFACAYGEVLLHFVALLAAKRRVGQYNIVAVAFLYFGQVLGQGVGMGDIGCFDAVQYHVHNANDVGQSFLFLAVEGVPLQGFHFLYAGGVFLHVAKSFAEESRATTSCVVHGVANFGVDDFDYGAYKRAGRVVFATVAPGTSHTVNAAFVQMAEFVFFFAGLEFQIVYHPQHFAEVVATGNAVAEFAEYLTNFVFDGKSGGFFVFEFAEVGEEFDIYKIDEVVARLGFVMVLFSFFVFWGCPRFPAVFGIDNGYVGFAFEHGFQLAGFFQIVQVFQE